MSLFVVQHRHTAETCPARDPKMAAMLLDHLSSTNAARFGVKIESEAVIDGGHALYMIVRAPETDNVNRFMEPFAKAGSVEILLASTCEEVVRRGIC